MLDHYIVRIYRRWRGDPGALVGTVEDVRSRRRAAFHDSAQLWRFLATAGDDNPTGEDRQRGKL